MTLGEQHLERGDVRLTALTRTGRGQPVVLLHGGMADAPAWAAVAEQLNPDRPLLVPNRRGRRGSTDPGEDYSVVTEVEDLLAWLATVRSPVDLVAHSYGGLIAVEAVRRGAPVGSLTLYDPVARPFAGRARHDIRVARRAGDLDTVVTLVNTAIAGYGEDHVERLRASSAWGPLLVLARPAAAELDAIEEFDPPWAEYGALGVPVRLIAGELTLDRSPYGDSIRAFSAALGVRPVILPGQDHIAHVTAPGLLAETIQGVVGRPSPGSDGRQP